MKNSKIDAAPTREFIINTITKDIRIQAAIFDCLCQVYVGTFLI
ncbi:hypothetical protein OSC52_16670 [Clostridium pasteurianum]|nr:hypothetical protein [Clostridium pasteurianum]UZW13456.1 hypothetical protein OSC52_16670 [Clostridium pasteurianum]